MCHVKSHIYNYVNIFLIAPSMDLPLTRSTYGPVVDVACTLREQYFNRTCAHTLAHLTAMQQYPDASVIGIRRVLAVAGYR